MKGNRAPSERDRRGHYVRLAAISSTLSPRIPRRISGLAGGIDAAPAANDVRTGRLTPRVDGGGRRTVVAANGAAFGVGAGRALGAIQLGPLLARVLQLLRTLPDHHWLDRLVRSRWWIAVLGVMLTAIVAMQVEVLKYGAGTGRSIDLATRLESRAQQLSANVAELASPQRIEQAASQIGMVMAGPTSVQFLQSDAAGSLRQAVASVRPPDAQSFMSALATATASAAAAAGDSTSTTAAGTSTTAAGTSTTAADASTTAADASTTAAGAGTIADGASTAAAGAASTAAGASGAQSGTSAVQQQPATAAQDGADAAQTPSATQGASDTQGATATQTATQGGVAASGTGASASTAGTGSGAAAIPTVG
ncbi:MAG: hypothetical protein ACLP01_21270 [Solirubrobacteraceae bacterium]